MNKKYVYIEVPSLSERIQDEPYGFFAEEHSNYFTSHSLNHLMKDFGYKNIYMTVDYMVGYKIANGFPMITVVYEKTDCIEKILPPIVNPDILLNEYWKYSEEKMQQIAAFIDSIPNDTRLAV